MPKPDIVGAYLATIGQFRLLTQEEEVLYGKHVQAYLEALNNIEDNLRAQSVPECEIAEQALMLVPIRIKRNYERARKIMVSHNLRLVVSVAKRYLRGNEPDRFMDMIQEGGTGLDRAVHKFDPTKGYKFSTYATWWIRQAITRANQNNDRSIRIPVHLSDTRRNIVKAYKRLGAELKRKPTMEEVAEACEMTVEKILQVNQWYRGVDSLDRPIDAGEKESYVSDFVPGLEPLPEDAWDEMKLRDDTQKLLANLPQREQQLLSMRFGLAPYGREYTLLEIGRELSLSRERVRQLERKALNALRGVSRRSRKFRQLETTINDR
jgi:RNA polymerase sigma factor (sigma-70 family)